MGRASGTLGFFMGAKALVDDPNGYRIDSFWCADIYGSRISGCAIYLRFILAAKLMISSEFVNNLLLAESTSCLLDELKRS